MEDADLVACGYRPLQVLRRTSSSKVILAESNSKKVVLKFLPEDSRDDGKERLARRSVSHEAQIVSSLDHRNIIQFIDHFTVGPTAVLVVKFASGGTLREYIRTNRRLDNELAQKLTNRLAEAISYLHNVTSIAHCDIKSENILFDEQMELKLADFGLAERVTRGSTTKTVTWKGSPSFAPPEAIKGKSRDPMAGDVWSFGVVVFNMVTGYLPFGSDSVHDILKKMDQWLRWPRPLNSVDRNCRKFVEMALRRNDSRRPMIKTMIRHPWLLSSSEVRQQTECCV